MTSTRSIHEYTDERFPNWRIIERSIPSEQRDFGDDGSEVLVYRDGLVVHRTTLFLYGGKDFAEGIFEGIILAASLDKQAQANARPKLESPQTKLDRSFSSISK